MKYESLTLELLPELWGPGEFWAVGWMVRHSKGYLFCSGQSFNLKLEALLYLQDCVTN
jgi:hypothetical protein